MHRVSDGPRWWRLQPDRPVDRRLGRPRVSDVWPQPEVARLPLQEGPGGEDGDGADTEHAGGLPVREGNRHRLRDCQEGLPR